MSSFDPKTAKPLNQPTKAAGGFDPSTAKPSETSLMRRAGDVGLGLLQGAIAVPEAAVGLADIATGGRTGKALEGLGFQPKRAKEILDTYKSDAYKDAQAKFQGAEGFTGKLGAAAQNPSLVVDAVAQSAPMMLGGGLVGRGIAAVAPSVTGRLGAGALGEGVVGAGSAASQIRGETEDGLLTGQQAALAGVSGAATMGLGMAGRKIAGKLGVGDIDEAIAAGSIAGRAGGPGILSGAARGALAEGVFEELPQSLSEQAIQNMALGRNVTEDLDAAAALGLLSGGAMGAGIGAASGYRNAGAQADPGLPGDAPQDVPQDQGGPAGGQEQVTSEPLALGFSPFAGTPVVFPDGSVALGSEQEQAMRDQRAAQNHPGFPAKGMTAEEAAQAAQTNVELFAQRQQPRQAGDTYDMLATAKEQGYDFAPVVHPSGNGFLIVPRDRVTPDMVQAAEQVLNETIERMRQADAAPVGRAERRRTDAVNLGLNTDPVAGYVDQLRATNTPAARAFVGEFDAGRITRQDVERRMQAERGKTPDEIIAEAAAQAAPAPTGLIATPSQRMGLNPNTGTLSRAAVVAVDSGASPATTGALDGIAATQTQQTEAQEQEAPAAGTAAAGVSRPTNDVRRANLARLKERMLAGRNANATQTPAATPTTGAEAPAVRSAGVLGGDEPNALGALNEQNTPPAATGQTQAPAVEAPEAARGDDAAASGVPAAGEGAGVRADGVMGDADSIAQTINASIADMAIKSSKKLYAEKVAKRHMTQEEADSRAAADVKTWGKQKPTDRTLKLAKAIAEKDPTVLVGAWAKEGQGTYGNEGSMEAFRRLTGINLKRLNSAARAKAIFDWAGWSEDQVRADVEKRKADKAKAEADYEAKEAAERAQRIDEQAGKTPLRIQGQVEATTVKSYVDDLIQQGYTSIGQTKRGAVKQVLLFNPSTKSGFPMPKGILADYAKQAAGKAESAPKAVPQAAEQVPTNPTEDAEQVQPAAQPVEQTENPFAAYNEIASQYGYEVSPGGLVGPKGKPGKVKMVTKGIRLRMESESGNLLASYPAKPESLERFLKEFWFAEKKPQEGQTQPAQQAAEAFDAKAAWNDMTPSQRFAMLDKWAGAGETDMGQRYKDRAWDSFNAGEKDTLTQVLRPAQQAAEAQPAPAAEIESIVVKDGKGLIKGKYLVEVDGDGAPGGPWDTPEQAMLAGEEWKRKTIQNAKDTAQERARWDAIAGKFKAGQEVTTAQIESLGLKAGTSDVRWFFPIAARLFNITSRDIRSIVKDLIRNSLTDMGAKREFVPTRKALEAVAADVAAEPAAEAPAKPASKTPTVDRHADLMQSVAEGKATPEQFKAGFAEVAASAEAIKAELSTKTKAELLRIGGPFIQMRYANETKGDVVDAIYRGMLGEFALGQSVTYGIAKDSYQSAVSRLVEATDADKLAAYAKEREEAIAEAKAKRAARAEALQNPKTLDDFRSLMNTHIREGKTRKEAFLMLTPEQRTKYDELEAESTKEARETRKRERKTEVRAAGQTTGGEIIATKHTRDDYDLFVVQLSDRLSKEDYTTVLSSAKRLGGWYSSFRGNGATPGFQFKDKASAEAFLKLAGGDTADAQAQAEQRRDAFEDDRSQTAAERLSEMADRMEGAADESLSRDRKANTERRARFAASAEREAQAQKAMAKTMRNIAGAIEGGTAKFLDAVRTKTQVEMLTSTVRTAKDNELRAKYPSYAEQEDRRGQPPTAETADFAEFPSYTVYRSDLVSLARQMLEVDGIKKLGQKLMKVADDVTDAYIEFAKDPKNLARLSTFKMRRGEDVSAAVFASRDAAERAIKRSGLVGRAIVLPVKRGENRVIMSPSEAINAGIWTGDGDKRITLSGEFGAELVEAIGRRGNKANNLTVPWQFQNAYDRRKALARMGIETPSEYRSALREFIGLQEQAMQNKVREMELKMVGRKADGLDFFPTPAEIADQMIEAADIEAGMRVLEPSAGMGHIADRIRATGAEPDVVEMSGERRELLKEKGYEIVADDFTAFTQPLERGFTFGDLMRAPDGTVGILRGQGGMGSDRVRLVSDDVDSRTLGKFNFSELEGVERRGVWSGYDRIVMNPPFSDRRDAEHVRHAYNLLKPGGRVVAIMGEGVFFGSDKKAQDFREWLESVGGTSEKLPPGSFQDPSLPVTTGVNARMVVIDKPEGAEGQGDAPAFSRETPRRGVPVDRAQSIVDGIKAKWSNAPEVVVVTSMRDPRVPERVQRADAEMRRSGATGTPKGFWFNGKAYIVAGAVRNDADVATVLFHEVLGHYGLRGTFGDGLKPILQQVATMRKAQMQKKAAEYGLDLSKERDRLTAAEEVLAEMAQDTPEIGFVKRAIAVIRNWLRSNVPMFKDLALTDAEIVNQYILPARAFVERGPGGGPRGGVSFMRDAADGAMFSRTAPNNYREAAAPVLQMLNDTFQVKGKLSWWHRTVGTQFNLAERVPEFKRVFDAAQSFINDVSFYGAEAAKLAPTIIPRLDSWRDFTKSPVSAADSKAIASPIFEGTLIWMRDESGKPVKQADAAKAAESLSVEQKAQRLLRNDMVTEQVLKMWQGLPQDQYATIINGKYESDMLPPGIVWTDAELRGIFGLNDTQVKLYNEFREATDKSLGDLALSDMVQYAGKDAEPIKQDVMDAGFDAGPAMLVSYLRELAKAEPDRADMLMDTANGIEVRTDKAKRLMDRGYAPLQRFGRYTVHVKDATGNQLFFGMFEDRWSAAQAARQMAKDNPGAKVDQGVMSEEAYKLFRGVSPETLEILGGMMGLDEGADPQTTKAFQTYLKLAKSNRSAMKRLIERKGIEGYSEDAGRVLASFIYSNARQTSANLHVGDVMNAVNDIPKELGDAKDAGMDLARYVMDPQEEAQKLRGLLFAQYLGGSIASAMVNALQPVQVTFPYLSQFVGVKRSGQLMTAAVRDALKKTTGDKELDAALNKAEEDGIVSPQEIHQLMAQAQGNATLKTGDGTKAGDARAAAQNALTKLSLGWGKVFSIPEQFNRRSTFIAAYRAAKETGKTNPAAFAAEAVHETQFVYNKGNRPKWARGAVGATVFTFKTYSIAYVELLQRLATQGGPEGRRAAALMIATLFLMAGAGGLPGAEDIEDVIDGIAQRVLGLNWQTRQRRQEWLADTFGEGAAKFIENGFSGLPGSPADLSGRLGLGNLVPGTGLFLKKQSYGRDVAEIVGPVGDMAQRFAQGAGLLLQGEVAKAAEIVSPVAVRNAIQGAKMAATDQYTDRGGNKVIETTAPEAALKAVGFQPLTVSRAQEASRTSLQMRNLATMREAEIADQWAKALVAEKPEGVQEAREALAEWNAKNPDTPIRITITQIQKRVRALREDRATRILRSTPKELRASVRRELADGFDNGNDDEDEEN